MHTNAKIGNLCILISSSVMPTLLVVTLSGKAWSVLRVQRQLPRGTRNAGKVIPGSGGGTSCAKGHPFRKLQVI